MKKKKITSLLLGSLTAGFLGLSSLIPAAATEVTIQTAKSKFTDENPFESQNGLSETFKAYQIFKGTYELRDEETVLADVGWADGLDGDSAQDSKNRAAVIAALKEALLKAKEAKPEDEDVEKSLSLIDAMDAPRAARALSLLQGDPDAINTFARSLTTNPDFVLEGVLSRKNAAGIPAYDKALGNELDEGYYLFIQVDEEGDNEYTASGLSLLSMVGGDETIRIKEKNDIPSLDKGIVESSDKSDSDLVEESGHYGIGQDVKFRLSAKLPDTYSNFEQEYKLVFHDTLSAGLSLDKNSFVARIGEQSISLDKEVEDIHVSEVSVDEKGNQSFSVTFDNLKNYKAVGNGDVIIVEYSAAVNGNAIIGPDGNPNEVYLEYSNNPYDQSSTGKTPKDEVAVYEVQLTINKVAPNSKYDPRDTSTKEEEFIPLSGAGFTLYRKVDDPQNGQEYFLENAKKGIAWQPIQWTDAQAAEAWQQIEVSEQEDKHTFSFKPLAAGEYVLVETKTPRGYNTMDNIPFTIETQADNGDDALDKLELTFSEKLNGELFENGEYQLQIVNFEGVQLPKAGGVGTTMLYAGGALILVVGATLLVFTFKKKENE